MLTVGIWWVCILVELAIIARGLQSKTVTKFPFFYLYIASLFFSDCPLYFVYVFDPKSYAHLNWNAGLLNLVLGSGVLLEIFRHALLPYPGAERFARITGVVVFLIIFSVLLAGLVLDPGVFQTPLLMNNSLERNLLAVQGIFLCCLIAIIRYYKIALSRNVLGIALGYGLCTGLTLAAVSIRLYAGAAFNSTWVLLQPLSYLLSLLLWAGAMWYYQPEVPHTAGVALGLSDYDSFVTATRGTIEAMRSNLGKAARP